MQTEDKLMIRALRGHIDDRPPFWLMRQAGRYLPEYKEVRKKSKNFLDFCYSPDLAVEVTLQPLRRYGMDAAIMFADILVIPDALGQQVSFKEGEGPVLEPIQNSQGLDILKVDGVLDHLSPIFETLRRLSKDIPETTTLIGFAGAPWTVAVYMVEGRGGTECGTARMWAYRAPEEFGKLIDILVEATSLYLIEQVRHGAEVLQLFDSWAGVLSPSQFQDLVIEPNRRIVENVRAVFLDIPIIGFPRMAGSKYKAFVEQTGVDAVSLDHTVPMDWAIENLQGKCTVQGQLDNHILMVGGEPLEKEVKRILSGFSKGPFVFNLGHGVIQFTPPENVALVSDIIRNWSNSA